MSKHPSISPDIIVSQIETLYFYAKNMLDKNFYIAYTTTGPNLNYYTSDQMAKMFACQNPPENVIFEENFAKLVIKHRNI